MPFFLSPNPDNNPPTTTTMSIQMSLVFTLLSVEIGLVAFLLLPLPPKLQGFLLKKYHQALDNSNLTIVLGFIDVLVSIMFVDAFKNGFGFFNKTDEIIEFNKSVWDARAKKFYSQRNLYILGAILALQIAVWFMSMLFRSTVKNKTKLVELSKQGTISTESSADLEKEVAKAELDVATLKKQYDALYAEYEKKHAEPAVSAEIKKDN